MEESPLSLHQLLSETKSVLKRTMPENYWIIAEISEIRTNYTGHCYLELIDKDETGETIKARARATIWAATFRMLQPYFESATHSKLTSGIRIMVKVTVELHELYGFSLNITDIEPSFTVGEAARQKQETIDRLISEGVFEMNKQFVMPEIPKKIAVISSETAAGYGDFMNQLIQNQFGYVFHVAFFPAVMQGDQAEQSIIDALDHIYERESMFDAVVLIRGGGSQAELSCFNSYWLAYHICQFPLPVLTGIGHERDESVADLVAHTSLKTPTAVAEFLIARFHNEDVRINQLTAQLVDGLREKMDFEMNRISRYLLMIKPAVREKIQQHKSDMRYVHMKMADLTRQIMSDSRLQLSREAGKLQSNMREIMINANHQLQLTRNRLKNTGTSFLEKQQYALGMLENKNQNLDPFLILKRGYSVTYYDGRALRGEEDIPKDALLQTRLHKGTIKSKKI